MFPCAKMRKQSSADCYRLLMSKVTKVIKKITILYSDYVSVDLWKNCHIHMFLRLVAKFKKTYTKH